MPRSRLFWPLVVPGILLAVLFASCSESPPPSADKDLVALVGQLAQSNASHIVLASTISAAAIVLAAVLIPLTVVVAVERHRRQSEKEFIPHAYVHPHAYRHRRNRQHHLPGADVPRLPGGHGRRLGHLDAARPYQKQLPAQPSLSCDRDSQQRR